MLGIFASIIVVLLVGLLIFAFSDNLFPIPGSPSSEPSTSPRPELPTQYTYSVAHIYPHDQNAFTEGFVYSDGYLYESTGIYGRSSLTKSSIATGSVLQEVHLPDTYFGEGIAVVNDTIVQLTWQEHTGFVYDKSSFAVLRNFSYTTQGWGLTYNGSCLVMSDGTHTLYFLDPVTFQITGHIQVSDNDVLIDNLNELEYVNGSIYANIWHQQRIAIINPQTGQVEGWVNLAGIEDSPVLSTEDVLNGIAYDSQSDRLFVTGKDWPDIFEIKLVPD